MSKPVEGTLTKYRKLSKVPVIQLLIAYALKSFESVNSILLTKSVTCQGKNLLVIKISRSCFNVFVSRARELKLARDHPYFN